MQGNGKESDGPEGGLGASFSQKSKKTSLRRCPFSGKLYAEKWAADTKILGKHPRQWAWHIQMPWSRESLCVGGLETQRGWGRGWGESGGNQGSGREVQGGYELRILLVKHSTNPPLNCKELETTETSLVVRWLRLQASNARGLGSIPGCRSKSHMPQLKIPRAPTKTWASQIDKYS